MVGGFARPIALCVPPKFEIPVISGGALFHERVSGQAEKKRQKIFFKNNTITSELRSNED